MSFFDPLDFYIKLLDQETLASNFKGWISCLFITFVLLTFTNVYICKHGIQNISLYSNSSSQISWTKPICLAGTDSTAEDLAANITTRSPKITLKLIQMTPTMGNQATPKWTTKENHVPNSSRTNNIKDNLDITITHLKKEARLIWKEFETTLKGKNKNFNLIKENIETNIVQEIFITDHILRIDNKFMRIIDLKDFKTTFADSSTSQMNASICLTATDLMNLHSMTLSQSKDWSLPQIFPWFPKVNWWLKSAKTS